MAGQKSGGASDVVTVDLPAPAGWRKQFTPIKRGIPKKNEIIFIAPSGEEFNTKKQVEQYLKSHPGGPRISEFDWSSGETPRRSVRLREKVKDVVEPEPEPKKKRGRKSAASKSEAAKAESVPEIINNDTDVKMQGMEDATKETDVDAKGVTTTNDTEEKVVEAQEEVELTKIDDAVIGAITPETAESVENPKLQEDSADTKMNDEGEFKEDQAQTVKNAEISGDVEGQQLKDITTEGPHVMTSKTTETGQDFEMQEDPAPTNTNAAEAELITVTKAQTVNDEKVFTTEEPQEKTEDAGVPKSIAEVSPDKNSEMVLQQVVKENLIHETAMKPDDVKKQEDGQPTAAETSNKEAIKLDNEKKHEDGQPRSTVTSDKEAYWNTETDKANSQSENRSGNEKEAAEHGEGKGTGDSSNSAVRVY